MADGNRVRDNFKKNGCWKRLACALTADRRKRLQRLVDDALHRTPQRLLEGLLSNLALLLQALQVPFDAILRLRVLLEERLEVLVLVVDAGRPQRTIVVRTTAQRVRGVSRGGRAALWAQGERRLSDKARPECVSASGSVERRDVCCGRWGVRLLELRVPPMLLCSELSVLLKQRRVRRLQLPDLLLQMLAPTVKVRLAGKLGVDLLLERLASSSGLLQVLLGQLQLRLARLQLELQRSRLRSELGFFSPLAFALRLRFLYSCAQQIP